MYILPVSVWIMCLSIYIICVLILLLAGDIETNPGPVTWLCPECSTSINIKKVQCVCGYVFVVKRGQPAEPNNVDTDIGVKVSKWLQMQCKRELESDTETIHRREHDILSKAKKRVL